jgi:hypothetical protein
MSQPVGTRYLWCGFTCSNCESPCSPEAESSSIPRARKFYCPTCTRVLNALPTITLETIIDWYLKGWELTIARLEAQLRVAGYKVKEMRVEETLKALGFSPK